jgi:hypothetical protein
MKKLLTITSAIALLTLAACAVMLTAHLAWMLDSWGTLPARVTALQVAVQELPKTIIPLVTTPVLAEVDKQATGLRHDTFSQVADIREMADRRMGDVLSRVDTTLNMADKRTGQALDQVAGLRADLKPTLDNAAIATASIRPVMDNAAALTKDMQDSLDSNYYDMVSLLDSAEVATTQVAQTMEVVRATTPDVAKSVDSVAGSVAREADQLTKPQTFWQGAKSWLLIIARCAGFLL